MKDHIRCEVVMEKGRYKMIICGSREEVFVRDKDAEGDMKMKYLDMLECTGKIWRWCWLLLSSLLITCMSHIFCSFLYRLISFHLEISIFTRIFETPLQKFRVFRNRL
ncbi:MAG: hypothetical protein DRP25_00365 [Thermotoga sp.]|nr:MAG: hypothetical protein DRP25_00365 [Thermotoga sp.]